MLSSNRDDSFIKLPKTSSVFLPRELRNLRVFVLFEVKMEIIMVLTMLVWIPFCLIIGMFCIFILLMFLPLFSVIDCCRLDEIFAY